MSQAKEVRAYITVRTERWGPGVVSPVGLPRAGSIRAIIKATIRLAKPYAYKPLLNKALIPKLGGVLIGDMEAKREHSSRWLLEHGDCCCAYAELRQDLRVIKEVT